MKSRNINFNIRNSNEENTELRNKAHIRAKRVFPHFAVTIAQSSVNHIVCIIMKCCQNANKTNCLFNRTQKMVTYQLCLMKDLCLSAINPLHMNKLIKIIYRIWIRECDFQEFRLYK